MHHYQIESVVYKDQLSRYISLKVLFFVWCRNYIRDSYRLLAAEFAMYISQAGPQQACHW